MRSLLIPFLLALAATPAQSQSYERAIALSPSAYSDQDGGPQDDRDPRDGLQLGPRDGSYGRNDGGWERPDRNADQGAYGSSYRQYQGPYGYRPPPRRRYRHAPAPVSRYAGFGNPVYYDDGMIRTGRDYPAGTVGLASGQPARPQVCTVRRSYYDAHQDRYRTVRRRVPCAQERYEEE